MPQTITEENSATSGVDMKRPTIAVGLFAGFGATDDTIGKGWRRGGHWGADGRAGGRPHLGQQRCTQAGCGVEVKARRLTLNGAQPLAQTARGGIAITQTSGHIRHTRPPIQCQNFDAGDRSWRLISGQAAHNQFTAPCMFEQVGRQLAHDNRHLFTGGAVEVKLLGQLAYPPPCLAHLALFRNHMKILLIHYCPLQVAMHDTYYGMHDAYTKQFVVRYPYHATPILLPPRNHYPCAFTNLGADFKFIREPFGATKPQTHAITSRVAIFERQVKVRDARPVIAKGEPKPHTSPLLQTFQPYFAAATV